LPVTSFFKLWIHAGDAGRRAPHAYSLRQIWRAISELGK
jgi:hypothetical protein